MIMMQLNGRKREVADWAMRQMIGKDYYWIDGVVTHKCKVLDIIDNETVIVTNTKNEETPVSIFDLRAV